MFGHVLAAARDQLGRHETNQHVKFDQCVLPGPAQVPRTRETWSESYLRTGHSRTQRPSDTAGTIDVEN